MLVPSCILSREVYCPGDSPKCRDLSARGGDRGVSEQARAL